MPTPITVPRLGWTMEEGTFLGWLKKSGDIVRAGDPLFTLEGEKASQDIEATEGGVLQIAEGGPQRGDTVKVGAVLAVLLESGTSSPCFDPKLQDEQQKVPFNNPAHPEAPAQPEPPAQRLEPPPCAVATAIATATVRISPRAARRAMALGVPWKDLRGTGRTGRIRDRDVLAAASAAAVGAVARLMSQNDRQPAMSELERQLPGCLTPLSPTRRTIALRLSEATRAAVPVTLTIQVDATQLVRLRIRLKEPAIGTAHPVPTFQDILAKFAAQALQEHSLMNAQWHENGLFFPDSINIAIAVDTQDGLLAPVLRDVPQMTLDQIAAASRRLIEQARAHHLQATDLEGGTFTITNLGGLGIDAFTPVLNPAQCAILGIGRIRPQAVVIGDDIIARETIPLSLTFDHRIVDGAPAARFLETLSRLIVNADGFTE